MVIKCLYTMVVFVVIAVCDFKIKKICCVTESNEITEKNVRKSKVKYPDALQQRELGRICLIVRK